MNFDDDLGSSLPNVAVLLKLRGERSYPLIVSLVLTFCSRISEWFLQVPSYTLNSLFHDAMHRKEEQ